MLSDCKFLTFTATAMRFTSFIDGSLAPKVVQIIESYNNLHAFFVIFVFSGDFLRFSAHISGPRFADGGGLREPLASSSPPRWGGGELRAGVTPVLRKGIDIRAAACGETACEHREQQRASARRGCGPHGSPNCILLTHVNYLQNLSSAAAGVAPKVRAAEDNTAKRCADACGLMQFEELRAGVTFYEKRVDIRAAGCAPNA